MVVAFFDLRFIFYNSKFLSLDDYCYAAFLDCNSFALSTASTKKFELPWNELLVSETSLSRMTLTEQCARFATAAEVLPKSKRLKPRRSCVPRTIRSAPQCL